MLRKMSCIAVLLFGYYLLVSSPPQVMGGTNCPAEWDWYSNANYNVLVGSKRIDCFQTTAWGTRTNYYHLYTLEDCGSCQETDYYCDNGVIIGNPIPSSYLGLPCGKFQ